MPNHGKNGPPPGKDLATLLRTLAPVLNEGVYCFVSVATPSALGEARAVATVREAEGWSAVITEADAADLALPVTFRAAWITLSVQSDLAAVGLTAAFAAALAAAGIGCNVVAGAWHDHLFVPVARAEEAMEVLRSLGQGG